MKKTFNLNGGLKCTDSLQLDKEELTVEVLDYIQHFAVDGQNIFNDPELTAFEKYRKLDNLESACAAVNNCLVHTIGIDIRDASGNRVLSDIFNRLFYFRQMAEIEYEKEKESM